MQRRRGFRPAASEPGPQGPQSGFSVLPGRARLSSRCKAGKRFPPGRSEAPERTGVRRPRFRQRKLSHNCCWHLCLEDTCKSLLQITKKLWYRNEQHRHRFLTVLHVQSSRNIDVCLCRIRTWCRRMQRFLGRSLPNQKCLECLAFCSRSAFFFVCDQCYPS